MGPGVVWLAPREASKTGRLGCLPEAHLAPAGCPWPCRARVPGSRARGLSQGLHLFSSLIPAEAAVRLFIVTQLARARVNTAPSEAIISIAATFKG